MVFKNLFFSEDWKELKKFEKLNINQKQIVFYAENKASFNHFRQLINELMKKFEYSICIVTSISDKNFLKYENIKIFYIGTGTARTKFFLTLKTFILITDTPDLDNFHIKKSKLYPVHYLYVFHSIFSTHSYLRENALDNFDTIFCVGKHHVEEIRKTEKIYQLKNKNLVEYGFGRIDELELIKEDSKNYKNTVIIAPSYGKNNLLECCGEKIIDELIRNDFQVVLRPHYRIFKESKKTLEKIIDKFCNNENFCLLKEVIPNEIFFNSIGMISDWSGISVEFTFVNQKPVIFIDVPKKNLNQNFQKIGLEPIEIELRNKIGYLINENNISSIIEILKNPIESAKIEIIDKIKKEIIFNNSNSAEIGSKEIDKILKKLIKK
jgi:hypothetical protein